MGLSLKVKPGDKDFKDKTDELIDLIDAIGPSNQRLSFRSMGAESVDTESLESTKSAKPMSTCGGSGLGYSGKSMVSKSAAPRGDIGDYNDPTYIQNLIQMKVNELFHDGLNMVELRPEKFYMPSEDQVKDIFGDRFGCDIKYKLKQAEEVFGSAPKGLPNQYQNLANLMLKNEKGVLRLDKERLNKFIDYMEWNDYVLEIHPTDVMFNPAIHDFDVFSITTGDVEKSGHFYLDMMEFLHDFNKDKLEDRALDAYLTMHLTTYEEFTNLKDEVYQFGSATPDGSREAQYRAHLMLKHLEDNFRGSNVGIGVETGPGLRSTKYGSYFIENDPSFFLSLLKGRKISKLVHDFAHGEFKTTENKKVKHILYAVERIGKYHVSGNTKKDGTDDPIDDLHEAPSPENLSTYWDTITLAKIVSENVSFSPEFTIKEPEDVETIKNYFKDLSSSYGPEDKARYNEWTDTLERSNHWFHPDNLDDKKVEELLKIK